MPRMSQAEIEVFLKQPLVAVLSSKRKDGSLHSTPIWFEYERGSFYLWVGRDSVKGRNVSRDPEVAVCIATSSEPYQYVSASGRAELTTDDLATRCLSIARRYYEESRARVFVEKDLASNDSVLLVLRPRRMSTEASA